MSDEHFYALKGVVAFFAIMLYSYHLWQIRNRQMPDDQKWRFIALFLASTTIFYASYEQINESATLNPRNVGGLITAVAICIAAYKSIRAEHSRVQPDEATEA